MKSHPKQKSIEEEYGITGPDGKPFIIPIGGSINLLILGYRGLMAWRAKRIEAAEKPAEGNIEYESGK